MRPRRGKTSSKHRGGVMSRAGSALGGVTAKLSKRGSRKSRSSKHGASRGKKRIMALTAAAVGAGVAVLGRRRRRDHGPADPAPWSPGTVAGASDGAPVDVPRP